MAGGLLLYMAAALLLGRSLRSTFGPVRQVAAPLPGGVVGGTNALAIVALVLGIFGGGVLAIPVGHVALNQIRQSGESGRGLAVAGLVLGYLSLIVIVGFVLVAVSAAYR